ncbi:MAG: hypothetical protein KAQ96_11650 [Thermoplasmata archaeon]|nr:hypothetical protein [Thermoplasmata archaeon]
MDERVLGLRKTTVVLLLMSILTVASLPPSSAVTIDGTDVIIVYEPASLTLQSGEWGTVNIGVTNVGNTALYFSLTANGVETNGGAWTEVEVRSFKIDPGESEEVKVEILSRARLFQTDDISDVLISIRYGPNATVRSDGSYDIEQPKSKERIEYDIIDEFSITDGGPTLVRPVIIIMVVVAIVVAFVAHRLWKRGKPQERDDPSPDGEEKGEETP